MANIPRFGNATVASDPLGRNSILDNVHREMAGMIGLEGVKNQIDRIVDFASLLKVRRDRSLPEPPISLHMVFRGPPGTGKTEVARKIAHILYGIKFTSKRDIVEVDRSTLTSQYANETPKVVAEKVQQALGGVLFIDEAYTLAGASAAPGSHPDKAGQEAIDTLLKAMEDHRQNLVVICAGYSNEMDKFMASNPGLASRFGFIIDFPSYSKSELRVIFDSFVAKYKYVLSPGAAREVDGMIQEMVSRATDKFGNAREVRQRFEKIIMAQASRISRTVDLGTISDQVLATIEASDVEAASV